MIRFKTSRDWKGERVYKGDVVNAEPKEIEVMLRDGLAYDDGKKPKKKKIEKVNVEKIESEVDDSNSD
jgi:hypothetical protein